MTLLYRLLLRLRQLLQTSRQVIAEHGAGVFLSRVAAWLGGERGYYRTLPGHAMSYAAFWRRAELSAEELEGQAADAAHWPDAPRFSVISALTDADSFAWTLVTLRRQTYPHWNWLVLLGAAVDNLPGGIPDDDRVRLVAGGWETALETADEHVIVLNAGDRLDSSALYRVASALRHQPEADILYTDSDHIDAQGERDQPFFKPDWSPEMMLSVDLLDGLLVARRELLLGLAAPDPFAGRAGRWDFDLRLVERAHHIVHLPHVLCHRPAGAAPLDTDSAAEALAAYLARSGRCEPRVWFDDGYARCTWTNATPRRASIIIPTRDQAVLLERCLESIFSQTDYPDYQVVLVDTGSTQPATAALYARYAAEPRLKRIDYTGQFNFSRACNLGAEQAGGDLLLFLNNDTEVLHPDWLRLMAQWFDDPQVGIVGAKLLYPDGRVQHAGIVTGINGFADNFLAYESEGADTLFGRDGWYRNWMAVTGACLMIRREVYQSLGGFDETYHLNFSDVDLGVRAVAAGWRVVYTPHVRLLHHESATHRRRQPHLDLDIAARQLGPALTGGDPYYNPNLSYTTSRPALHRDEDDTPAFLHRQIMGRLDGVKTPPAR